ncbi:YppF family protein [Bacillus sp. Marseille-P3661]|uniref:YppF family protein n=1 Tax=Bacillus sp. Marseille-P3661 TaxID=1936234 RepID=UPI000C86368A|nr:YppF family protein [Bacillus sp. Marseille-P3661]
MSFEELMNDYILHKKQKLPNINQLLDFVQLRYIQGELCLSKYRCLLRELHERGAVKPEYYVENLNSKAFI